MLLRSLSLFLAFTLFISSSGLLIQTHFCQNQLQSISIFLNPESCHKNPDHHCNAGTKKCCKTKQTREKDNCCHSKKNYVKLDLDQYFFKQSLKEKKNHSNTPQIIANRQAFSFFTPEKIKFFRYKPPLIEFDFQTVFQIFLC